MVNSVFICRKLKVGAIVKTINQTLQHQLTTLIDKNFHQQDLKESALESIYYKEQEGFPFSKLAILHFELFGGTSDIIYQAAAAVEFLITSSDIYDDLQDNDNNIPPWSQWPPALAMNVATAFFAISNKLLSNLPIEETHKKLINQLHLEAINGQHADLVETINTEQQYVKIAEQKAGSLVALASLVGTGLATPLYETIVKDYSVLLGVAEQIKNDLQDLLSFEKNDWILRKKSLPILYLYENNINSVVIDYFEGRTTFEEILEMKDEVHKSLTDSGAIMYTNFVIRKQQLLAVKLLEQLPFEQQQREKIKQAFHFN